MDGEFTLPKDGRFAIEYALPKAYRGIVLRGAKVVAATGESGSIIVQTYEQPFFTIRFKVVEFFRSVKISFHHKETKLISILALKNNFQCRIKELGVLKLSAGQFSLFHCREHSFVTSYEKDKIYHSLEVNWAEEIIKENAPHFKLLQQLLHRGQWKKNFFISNHAHAAPTKLLDLANEILKSPYDTTVSGLLFQHKSREFFILIMVAIGKVQASGLNFTAEEWEKIHAIAQLLRNEPDKKFPITTLATQAQMNPTKLKEGFREKYDSGMFEYQMHWRMKEALRLLEETDIAPKDISARVGYRTIGSFITKFREYYGYPPGKVVRKFK